MADVTIKYNGSAIAEMSETGSKTLKTSGNFCEGNFDVEYIAKETGLANAKRWDITITSGVPASGAELILLTDNWLKENRTNPNLCVAMLPKFAIAGATHLQGVYLTTNKPIMQEDSGINYCSMSAYKHSGGYFVARMRKYTLTNANDAGDLGIKSSGALYAIAYGDYDMAVGDYVVFAFII